MIKQDYLTLLQKTLTDLKKIEGWLLRSYEICKKIGVETNYSDEGFDAFEVLTSRFARATDFITNKIFRTIDKMEFESDGTLIDVINRAEKRGLIGSTDEMRQIKELRNRIAHDYTDEEFKVIFAMVFKYTPRVFNMMQKIYNYCGTKYNLK